MKIHFDVDGKIGAIGTAVHGQEIDETALTEDFLQTFSLGKYKARQNKDDTISIVSVPGWTAPEKTVYDFNEIGKMSKDQLLALQARLQEFIDKAAV